MTKSIIIIIFSVLLVASVNVPLAAQGGGQHKMMRHAGFGNHMMEKNFYPARLLLRAKDKLGLTDEQANKIEAMSLKFTEAMIQKKADIKIKELKFKALMRKDNVNRGKMAKMIQEIAGMKTNMQIDRMNYMLDIKQLLTPEQIKKIDEFKRKHHKKRFNKRFDRKRGARRGDRPSRRQMQEPQAEPQAETEPVE